MLGMIKLCPMTSRMTLVPRENKALGTIKLCFRRNATLWGSDLLERRHVDYP